MLLIVVIAEQLKSQGASEGASWINESTVTVKTNVLQDTFMDTKNLWSF